MKQETFALSQKELQRVTVISACIKPDLRRAGAAESLDLTPRLSKSLKTRYRQRGVAALARLGCARSSPCRLPERIPARILERARTHYAGCNDRHLCGNSVKWTAFLSVATLSAGRCAQPESPSCANAALPRHRERRLARAWEGEMLLLDAGIHH